MKKEHRHRKIESEKAGETGVLTPVSVQRQIEITQLLIEWLTPEIRSPLPVHQARREISAGS